LPSIEFNVKSSALDAPKREAAMTIPVRQSFRICGADDPGGWNDSMIYNYTLRGAQFKIIRAPGARKLKSIKSILIL
jgi:hypothetical protein